MSGRCTRVPTRAGRWKQRTHRTNNRLSRTDGLCTQYLCYVIVRFGWIPVECHVNSEVIDQARVLLTNLIDSKPQGLVSSMRNNVNNVRLLTLAGQIIRQRVQGRADGIAPHVR